MLGATNNELYRPDIIPKIIGNAKSVKDLIPQQARMVIVIKVVKDERNVLTKHSETDWSTRFSTLNLPSLTSFLCSLTRSKITMVLLIEYATTVIRPAIRELFI